MLCVVCVCVCGGGGGNGVEEGRSDSIPVSATCVLMLLLREGARVEG